MKNISSKEWAEEFQKFVSASELKPPQAITEKVITRIRAKLNPSPWIVFSKMALIHMVTGFITLLFCPQFGISLFEGMGLMAIFMRFGETACMVGCGAVFLGGSTMTAAFVLRTEELRVIRKNKLLQIPLLAMMSFGTLICFGATTVSTLAVAWLAGSILGGLASLELGWIARKILNKRIHAH